MSDSEKLRFKELQDIDRDIETLTARLQRTLEHRREFIHRNSLNKNPAFEAYLSRGIEG